MNCNQLRAWVCDNAPMKITHASTLSDSALITELSRLAGRERAATVTLIVQLAEFDARRLHAGAGYSSTFRYCLDVLHLSEDATFKVSSSLDTTRKEGVAGLPEVTAGGAPGADSPRAAGPPGAASESRSLVRPLAADRYEVRSTASTETRDYLRRAQDLLGHAIPSGDLDQVFNRALRLLVGDLERKKFAATERARRSRGQSVDSRNMPARVKRAVRQRDGDGCAWVAPNGRRCGERRFLEFHHDDPWGVGGQPTIDRVRLLCRTHNAHEAELFYGPGRRWSIRTPPVPGRVNESPAVPAASAFRVARGPEKACADT
jgi:hypothetical protein